MKRASWMTQAGRGIVVAVAVAILAGVAWADPTGNANVPQIQFFANSNVAGGFTQRTFLTTDPIRIRAIYYDPLLACDGVAPTFVQLFVFTAEGRFLGQFDGTSSAFSASNSKSRELQISLAAGTLPAGTFKFTFLVRDCTNTKSVVQPALLTLSVFFAP